MIKLSTDRDRWEAAEKRIDLLTSLLKDRGTPALTMIVSEAEMRHTARYHELLELHDDNLEAQWGMAAIVAHIKERGGTPEALPFADYPAARAPQVRKDLAALHATLGSQRDAVCAGKPWPPPAAPPTARPLTDMRASLTALVGPTAAAAIVLRTARTLPTPPTP